MAVAWLVDNSRHDVSNLVVLQSPTMDHSNPIDNVTIFNGLASLYGAVKSIAPPRLDGDGNFYITAQVHGAELWRYYLNRANLMQPIPQRVLDRKSTLFGVARMVKWWNHYKKTLS